MDITEQRRLKSDAAHKPVEKVAEPKAKDPESEPASPIIEPVPPIIEPAPQIIENTKTIERKLAVPNVKLENVEVIKSKNTIPVIIIARSLAFVLSLIAVLFIISSEFSKDWAHLAAAKLNTFVVYGSYFVLRIIQGSCTVDGGVLNTHYYKVSLQGDWVAFYSIELLVIFAFLFAFFQKITRIQRGVVFISLIPLAIVANIFRVVMACGLAMNDGPAYADRSLHGILVGVVFIIIILGLILLEFLFSPE